MNLKKILKIGRLELWSKYKEQLRREHKLSYLFWECTLNCNFFCKHCGSSAGRGKFYKGELTTQEIETVLKNIADNFNAKDINLAVTGGEPLLRQDLFEVMSYAKGLGFSWGMVTNGYLMTPQMAQKAKKTGMKTVVVSIDGIGKIHDDFRGMPGAYKKAVKAVKILKKANFLTNLQITTSIHNKNIHLLDEMYQEFSKLGIDSWRTINVDPIGRGEQGKDILLNELELKELLEFIRKKRKKLKPEVTYGCAGYLGTDFEGELRPWLFNCNTGINTGSILHNGDIFVCPNVPRNPNLIQGNVRKESFSVVWNNKFKMFRNKNRTACAKCRKCDDWEYCLGNSFHLWDFKKKEPKMCHKEMLEK